MINIAIDGPSGAGKSKLSGTIAEKLSLIHVDTGELYRAVGFYVLNNGVEPSDTEKVVGLLDSLRVEVKYDGNRHQHVYINGVYFGEELRTEPVAMAASVTSAIPEVREFLLSLQRDIAARENIIMDGRDVGTVILPDADVKIFLSATPEKRAARRLKDYLRSGKDVSYEKVLEDIIQRDKNDSTRAIAPLKKADDAIEVDNSEMDESETVEYVLNIIRGKLN